MTQKTGEDLKAQIEGLRTRFKGELVTPADPSYNERRSVWNGMIDKSPALIARCIGTSDVIAAVRFAREAGLPVSVRGGGHNIAGTAIVQDGVVIDLSPMRGVWVDPDGRVARVQAGCQLGDVDRETQLHGLATALGFVSLTGVAGLTLGGGFGYLTRRFGWTVDNLLACEVVTANGELVRASRDENEDLFWALRGGGGNFGIVTNFTFQLHELGPEVTGGLVLWPQSEAKEIIRLFRELTQNGSRDAGLAFTLRNAPPAPFVPPEYHGKPVVGLVVCHSGTAEEAERDLAPFLAHAKPIANVLARKPYVAQQSMLDATQPNGLRYYWKTEFVSEVSDELIDALTGHAAKIPVAPASQIICFALGGRLQELDEDDGAMGNRDAQYVVGAASGWKEGDDAEHIGWARAGWEAIRAFSTGGTYVNFLNAEEGEERVRDAYRKNLDRLVEVKAKWDPDNFFRSNKNIAPVKAGPKG